MKKMSKSKRNRREAVSCSNAVRFAQLERVFREGPVGLARLIR